MISRILWLNIEISSIKSTSVSLHLLTHSLFARTFLNNISFDPLHWPIPAKEWIVLAEHLSYRVQAIPVVQVQAISIFFLVKTSKIWRATKVFPQPAIPPKYTLCPLLTRSKIICCCSLRLQAALYKKEKKHPISVTKNSLYQLFFSKEKHDKVYNYIDKFIN